MPIKREHRFFYPIDWRSCRSRSASVGRGMVRALPAPHGQNIYHLGDGRWWDREVCAWRDGDGEILRVQPT